MTNPFKFRYNLNIFELLDHAATLSGEAQSYMIYAAIDEAQYKVISEGDEGWDEISKKF